MALSKRTYWVIGLAAIVALIGGVATVASGGASSHVIAGQIDDGAELLDQASITLEEAIAAAQTTGPGAVGEVDLEKYQGRLVFNVDIGDRDVKIDSLVTRPV